MQQLKYRQIVRVHSQHMASIQLHFFARWELDSIEEYQSHSDIGEKLHLEVWSNKDIENNIPISLHKSKAQKIL